MARKKDVLDAYEQEIENQLEQTKSIQNKNERIAELVVAAKEHIQNKKPITIRLSIEDLKAIKAKAAKCGLPYQTYLNMIIHKDAIS